MTFLPVVERELRVAARRRWTYWGRFAAAVIGAGLAAWILLASDQTNTEMGAVLFRTVSAVIFLYATVAGVLVTCDCLSVEKREGTLGLLFLTDLKGHDVVLGKLAATSVNAFYGMLAVFPMLAIPFILGGVTQAEMLRVVLVAIALVFLFLSIGIFVSALCRKDNWALGLSIMIGLILMAGGPVWGQFKPKLWIIASLSSPAAGCFLAFDEVYSKQPHSYFWINVVVTQIYTWIFFGITCWIVPRSWQDAAVGRKWPWVGRSNPARRAKTRSALLDINPFLWRVARSGRKQMLVWAALFVLTLLWTRYARWLNPRLTDPFMDFFLLVPAGLILKGWMAAEASRTFSEDRHSGGMELLLTTPLHEQDILRGQMLSLWRQFAAPAGVILLVCLAFLLAEVRQWDSGSRPNLLKFHLLFGGFLAADMIALSWVGAWQGLIKRSPNRAALLSFTQIMILPSTVFLGVVALSALLPQRWPEDKIETAAFWFWTVLGLGFDFAFGFSARQRLRSEFRTIVSQGFERKRPARSIPKPVPALAEAQ